MEKKNWFNTLNEALESENLIHLWDIYRSISYSETFSDIVADGSNYRHISIYRNEHGMYERPTTYITGKRKNG